GAPHCDPRCGGRRGRRGDARARVEARRQLAGERGFRRDWERVGDVDLDPGLVVARVVEELEPAVLLALGVLGVRAGDLDSRRAPGVGLRDFTLQGPERLALEALGAAGLAEGQGLGELVVAVVADHLALLGR